jgi:DNA-binding NarL/FixJ family response regulator
MKSPAKAAGKVIRILLADDHPVVREGLVSILKAKDIKVIGEASNGEEACKLYDQLSPDILILDLRMPKKDGLQVVTELMSRRPKPRIIVMTTYEGEEDVRRALSAGAKGYVLKGTKRDQILNTGPEKYMKDNLRCRLKSPRNSRTL